MDSHVRWFRRKIGLALLRRLASETLIIAIAASAVVVVAGGGTERAVMVAVFAIVLFSPLRWGVACLTNPTSSSYLTDWTCPSGDLVAIPRAKPGSSLDLSLHAAGLRFYGAYLHTGGATMEIYGSEEALLVVTTAEEDVQVISNLVDGRLLVSTTMLIPPHERLIVNHRARADVSALLASHRDLLVDLKSAGSAVAVVDPRVLVDMHVLEWEAWQEVGLVLSPVVDIDHRLNLTMLTVRVSSSDVLAKGMANAPVVDHPPPPARAEPLPAIPARDEVAAVQDDVASRPFTALAALHRQAELAAHRTDQALAVRPTKVRQSNDTTQPEPVTR